MCVTFGTARQRRGDADAASVSNKMEDRDDNGCKRREAVLLNDIVFT